MTTAPAETPATTTATRPEPGQRFTRTQKLLIGIVVALVLVIAGIGFAGSYAAVTKLAAAEGFGRFAHVFPIGVDSGIGAFLALDLLLTWLRIPFPMLRYGAWALTAATIAFNSAAAWPDPLGVGMHGTIPLLFVIAVEAARHAIGRIADITADKHIELPPIKRWVVAPWPTFRLWRRQIMWQVRSYDQAITIERQRQVYRSQLRARYGSAWRRKATADELLALRLATRSGMTIAEALALPQDEARAQAEAEAKRRTEAELARARTEAEALRIQAEAKAEAEALARTEAEAKRQAEALQAEAEAAARTEALREAEAARILKAQTEARLADIARSQQQADLEAERRRQQYLDEQEAKRAAARRAHEAAEREAEAKRRTEAEAARTRSEAEAARARSEALRVTTRTEAPRTANPKPEANPNPKPGPKQTANLGGARAKKQAEVEAILAVLTEAGDPKALGLEDVKDRFDLKHAAAWDRLSTARALWEEEQKQSA